MESDPDVTVMYLPQISSQKNITRHSLQVALSSRYNRRLLPLPYENHVNLTWEERLQKNPRLWDATKFRIESVEELENSVIFNIGVTSYKEFIGTNWSPNAKLYRELGLKDHSNSQAYMSDALGVGALLETADEKIVLLKRGDHLAEAPGLWDIPGGHPEVQVLIGKVELSEIVVETLSETDVVDEIFNSVLNEIVSEVNVPLKSLSEPYLLGIARNTTSAGRPSSEYYVRCEMDSSEVLLRYQEGTQAEADETIGIKFLAKSQISRLRSEPNSIWNELAPSAKGCLMLYSQQSEFPGDLKLPKRTSKVSQNKMGLSPPGEIS